MVHERWIVDGTKEEEHKMTHEHREPSFGNVGTLCRDSVYSQMFYFHQAK